MAKEGSDDGAKAAAREEDDDDEDEVQQKQFKIILLGDGAVGKTSIAHRFTNDSFSASYKQTIGLDFFIRRLTLPGDVHCALQIWDIGGQTIGSKMIHNYIYGAHAVILCYDITNPDSFQNLEDWYRLVKLTFEKKKKKKGSSLNAGAEAKSSGVDAAPPPAFPHCVLVGNKLDLQHMRMVPVSSHNRFTDENDMFGYQLSAKSGDQVGGAFFRIAATLAGVPITKGELESQNPVMPAQIIQHTRTDDEGRGGAAAIPEAKQSGCVVS